MEMTMENKVGEIHYLSYNDITVKNTPDLKNSLVMDVDDSELKNPFPYTKSKDRRMSLERYEDFFYSNLENGNNIKIFVAMSTIESALESGKNVYLLTQRPKHHSHGQIVYKFFLDKLEKGMIQYAEKGEDESPIEETE